MTDPHDASLAGATPTQPGDGTYDLLVLIGAELSELLERLVRRQSGMTLAQFRVLELAAAGHPARQEPWQLGEKLGIASNHLSAILDQLEARDFVRRHAHPSDGRRRLIEISAAGRAEAARVHAMTAALQARIVESALSTTERAELTRLLGTLQAQIVDVGELLRRRPGP